MNTIQSLPVHGVLFGPSNPAKQCGQSLRPIIAANHCGQSLRPIIAELILHASEKSRAVFQDYFPNVVGRMISSPWHLDHALKYFLGFDNFKNCPHITSR